MAPLQLNDPGPSLFTYVQIQHLSDLPIFIIDSISVQSKSIFSFFKKTKYKNGVLSLFIGEYHILWWNILHNKYSTINEKKKSQVAEVVYFYNPKINWIEFKKKVKMVFD